jgi:hypothetical protein
MTVREQETLLRALDLWRTAVGQMSWERRAEAAIALLIMRDDEIETLRRRIPTGEDRMMTDRPSSLARTVGPLLPVEPPLFLPVVLHLDLEPLQRSPRHVAGLRVLRHNALIPARHRFLPRFEPVIRTRSSKVPSLPTSPSNSPPSSSSSSTSRPRRRSASRSRRRSCSGRIR